MISCLGLKTVISYFLNMIGCLLSHLEIQYKSENLHPEMTIFIIEYIYVAFRVCSFHIDMLDLRVLGGATLMHIYWCLKFHVFLHSFMYLFFPSGCLVL